MGYTMVNCYGTEFAVDWEVGARLNLSYWKSAYQYKFANEVTMSESSWYNPFSWSLPSIKSVDIPWDKVREAAQTSCNRDMSYYQQSATRDMPGVAQDVQYKLERVGALRKNLQTYLKDIQSANMASIDKSVNDYTGLIEYSRFLRDSSADIVAIGSTIATGGAAAGLLGASSAMKGWGKYQDTGSVGAAAVYGAGSIVLGAFKVGGKTLTSGGEYVLIVAKGALEMGTSLVAGDKFSNAIERGFIKVASEDSAHALFSSTWIKRLFSTKPVPLNVSVAAAEEAVNKMTKEEAAKLAEKTAKKATEKGVKAATGSATKHPPSTAVVLRRSSAGLIEDVPIEKQLLLYLGIVNMKKGIGHGW